MIRDYVTLSFVSLKNRGLRSWLTIIGIFIGIAAVISLISLGEGLRAAVLGQFYFLTTDILTVQASGLNMGPPGEGVTKPLQEEYVEDIEALRGVDMAIGRIIEDAKIQFNGRTDFTFAGSMPDGEKRKEVERIAQFEAEHGRMLKDGDNRQAVLGYNYALSDQFDAPVDLRDKVLINGKEFTVVGLLKKKGSFIVDNAILINEQVLKEDFGINDTYDIIAVKMQDGADIKAVKQRVEDFLREERDVEKGEEDFTVESPEQMVKDLDSTLLAVRVFIYIIAGISIVVGGIGIANTMYTSVVERTKQIGIMKSIGARNSNIFSLFLIEAGLLGTLGGLFGIAFGLGLAYGLAAIGRLALGTDFITVTTSWNLVLGAFIFSFLIGALSGVMPALQAAHLKPVDAIRGAR